MPKYIAGNPKIILKIKGGSGGRIAANYMHNAAPKDGSMFSIVLQTVPAGTVCKTILNIEPSLGAALCM